MSALATDPVAPAQRRQAAVGLLLASLILSGWLALHLWGVFFFPLHGAWLWVAPLQVALQTWLSVGLFIVAHDAMHGSLAPGHARLNRAIGQLCVGAYAGFSYGRLHACHHRHHAAPGTPQDPDFHAERPQAFGPWFLRFFLSYFGWRELALLTLGVGAYLLAGARLPNLLLFWALPALLSALQLFIVGTWLPHRHRAGQDPARDFVDPHRARTLDLPWLASLLACFHFGLHHEHHRAPHVPWWRLPAERRAARPAR
ncbi:fatty acid desaturase [Ramlibacter tataouinensis]|uniref:Candidate beta-carotene ketolase (Beta-carotene oxygenase) n=1 Tax=Ramlibacter tataouinensis (strain ATCC BAA-407 / DSM 14655 / LMG 21543 / TTB310) TaxID=365046 RepID=F5XXP7_RAMTT|nr:fatty acid desaturase [Ramlibacter tataouinensis]AEG91850.1 candidate beta-carotene ketolase (Beta-carotene oxygenase) [Ramlibacter tataouinensis TTB310]